MTTNKRKAIGQRRSIHSGLVRAFTVAGLLALPILTGCGKGGLHLAPVSGFVSVDGKPVADVGVMFSPLDSKAGPPAVGTTDDSGRFTLVTANREGAVVGEHRVAISKDENIAIPQSRGFPIYKSVSHVAPKFGRAETSGLTAKVADDDNEFDFKVTSK
jgi:hypothetical protein